MEYATPVGEQDFAALFRVINAAFDVSPEEAEEYRERIGDENFRLVREGADVPGGLALLPMGQYFGGRRVSSTGIAAVAVAAEARGRGVASELMAAAVRELFESGVALSVLYPATERLYRRSGYEQSGSLMELRLPLRAIQLRDRDLPVRELTDADRPLVAEFHRKCAVHRPGNLDRIEANWRVLWRPMRKPASGFLLGPDSDPQGYMLFRQQTQRDPWQIKIHVSDHVFSTPAAGRRLLTLLADHGAQVDHAILTVGPADPLTALLLEQYYRLRVRDHWMLRVVNLRSALAERGYDRGVEIELHLEVDDDLIPANKGRWTLRVADGRGVVEEGGRGELRLDIRALAPLYSGHMSVATLRTAGWLSGPEDALAAAQAVFGGPAPWIGDSF